MNINRREVMERDLIFGSWLETKIATKTKRKPIIMSDVKDPSKTEIENAFDFEIQKAPEKGKPCHMQVDEDLHIWLNQMRTQKDVTFRKFANMMLCKGIQQYIRPALLADPRPLELGSRTQAS
jgi:hypothetical protein